MLECEAGYVLGRQASLYDDGVRALPFHGCECRVNLVQSAHGHNRSDFDSGDLTAMLYLTEDLLPGWIGSIAQCCNALYRRQHVTEQLDAFAMQLRAHQRHSGDVPAGARKARYETGTDGIRGYDDDWDLLCRLLCCERTGRVNGDDDIDLERDELCGKPRKKIEFARR